MKDIEIARAAKLFTIDEVAKKYNIDDIEFYGKYKAKLSTEFINKIQDNNDGKLILVTSVNPTPAGEGKTTVSIGLAQALEKIGKKTVLALREPSLGPCFGLKGGATGGGYSQIVPMEDINLHFTGDFHAITYANNLLASIIDNHIHQGNELKIDTRRILWKRCIDLNDRSLRNVVIGLGQKKDGFTREDHFIITVASEVMAILCLSSDLNDLRERLDNILVAYDIDNNPVYAKDLNVTGALLALLKDAIKPNIVQTIENTLAIVHGGPFANIAHGCNSVIATKTAMKLGEYAITESGFGADLGAEKFLDIKCRVANLKPSYIVIVGTIRSIKYNGNIKLEELGIENLDAIKAGITNIMKHIENIRRFGYEPVVALNRFPTDTDNEINLVKELLDVDVFDIDIYSKGGNGAIELAKHIDSLDLRPIEPQYIYDLEDSIEEKIQKVCQNIYGAKNIRYIQGVRTKIKNIEKNNYGKLPICIAKTQYSLSDNPKLLGRPKDFDINISDVYLSSGARMIVVLTGDIMTMPGLSKAPQALKIDVNEKGEIIGLN